MIFTTTDIARAARTGTIGGTASGWGREPCPEGPASYQTLTSIKRVGPAR